MTTKLCLILGIMLLFICPYGTQASTLVNEITVGDAPGDIQGSSDGSKIYVVNIGNDVVSVIDAKSNTLLKNVYLPAGSDPSHFALSMDGKELYVTERLTGKVKIISTDTDTIVGSISTLSNLLNDLALSPDGSKLYVTSALVRGTIRMTVVDLATQKPINYFDTADAQDAVVISPDGASAYIKQVVNNSDPSIVYTTVLDTKNLQQVGILNAIQVDYVFPGGQIALGHDYGRNIVEKIDLVTGHILATSTELLSRPNQVIVDSNSNPRFIFVSNDNSKAVSILDAKTLDVVEVVETRGLHPTGIFVSRDRKFLYVSNVDEDSVQVFDIESIEETQAEDIYDFLHELIAAVEGYGFKTSIENSYIANLKKVEDLLNSARYIPAENQLRAFVQKLEQDHNKGTITDDEYNDLLARANKVIKLAPEGGSLDVPLMTQVVSPYPSVEETSSWATSTYADGRADKPNDCGKTIGQCGCAITSFSMVGNYYGIDKGFDGTSVDPLNLDHWLLSTKHVNPDAKAIEDGYDSVGNIRWAWGLAYLGTAQGDKYASHLRIDNASTNVRALIDEAANAHPVLGFYQPLGHWMVLTGTTTNGFSVRDPYWYNTRTTDDKKDVEGSVQDYNDVITKGFLLSYQSEMKPIQELLQFTLHSPAELLVTDEKGRRTGFDPATHSVVSEIPGAVYDPSYVIKDQANPDAAYHTSKQLMLIEPEGEHFTVEVIGTGSGDYTLDASVSDGTGHLFDRTLTGTTAPGKVESFTVTTLAGTDALPAYLTDILALVPTKDQKKFIQAFTVVSAQTEKDHVAVTKVLIGNLIRHVESHYGKESWEPAVAAALRTLMN